MSRVVKAKAKSRKVKSKVKLVKHKKIYKKKLPLATCPYCANNLPEMRSWNMRFCSENHRVLYNAHKQYIRHGKNPAFKKKARIRTQKWIKKNTEKWNELMREAMFRRNLKKKIARELKERKNG